MSRGLKAFLSFVALLVVLGGLFYVFRDKDSSNPIDREDSFETQSTDEQPQSYSNVDSRLLVVGDIFWGRHIELLANQSEDPVDHPFRGLNTLERNKYDSWIANVECPITNNVVPYQTQIDTLIFNCPPKFLEGFSKYFDIVSLANNHTDNQGIDGLYETRGHLDSANLQYFGHYDNTVTDDLCDVITVDARVDGNTTSFPIAMCGFHGVFNTPTQEQINTISRYSDHFITIAMPHSGAEYKPEADTLKIETYRAMADAGADIVIGGHPHWVQDSEVYDGKLIVYSLGNFIFDQNFNADVSRGVGVDISLSIEGDDQTESWLNMAEGCRTWQDSCLNNAKTQDLTKPPFSAEFDLVSVDNINYLTSKASEATHNALLERTKWQQSMAELEAN